jgi:hypothetical protein
LPLRETNEFVSIEADSLVQSVAVDAFEYALKSNDAWANYKGHQNPAFFAKAAAGQSPQICKYPSIAGLLWNKFPQQEYLRNHSDTKQYG